MATNQRYNDTAFTLHYEEETQEEQPQTEGLWKWLSKLPRRAKTLGKIVDKCDTLTQDIDDKGMFSTLLKEMGVTDSDVALAMLLSIDTGRAFYNNDKETWTELIAKLGIVFVVKGGITTIWKFMRNQFKGIEAQGPEDLMFAGITTIVMLAVFYGTGGNEVSDKNCKTVWDKMSKKGRDITNIKMGITSVISIFMSIREMVIDCCIAIGIFDGDSDKSLNRKFATELYGYSSKISVIKGALDKSKMRLDKKMLECYEELVEHKRELNEMLLSGCIEKERIFMYNSLGRDYDYVCTFFSDKYLCSPVKVDPPHYSFYGEPGIGKASVLQNATELALKFFGQSLENNVYSCSGCPKYFDNYKDQFIMVIDEKDATLDLENVQLANEIQSSTPKILPMASVEKKGRPFNSKLIFSCTNQLYPMIEGVADIRAYHRRSMKILCQPTQEFAALPKAARHKSIDNDMLSHLTFSVLKYTDQNVMGHVVEDVAPELVGMTFAEMMRFVLTDAEEKLQFQHKKVHEVDPTFPFDMPVGHYDEIEVAIAEMISTREMRTGDFVYASTPLKLGLSQNELLHHIHQIVDIRAKRNVQQQEFVNIPYTPEQLVTIRKKLDEYKKKVYSHSQNIVRSQGPKKPPKAHSSKYVTCNSDEDLSEEYSTMTVPLVRKEEVMCLNIKHFENVIPCYFKDECYFLGTRSGDTYLLEPTPELTLYYVLSLREHVIEGFTSSNIAKLSRKYKMTEEKFKEFMKSQLQTIKHLDNGLLSDVTISALLRTLDVKPEKHEFVIEMPEDWSKTPLKGTVSRVRGLTSDITSTIKVRCIKIGKVTNDTLITALETIFSPELSFNVKADFGPWGRSNSSWKITRNISDSFRLITGKVGKFVMLPTFLVSYETLAHFDFDNYDEWIKEANRTGSVRHAFFYFLQHSNNQRMNMQNGCGSGLLDIQRLLIEGFFYVNYTAHSFISFVIGTTARVVLKITKYIVKCMNENPKVSLAIGVLGIGILLYSRREKKEELSINCESNEKILKIQGHAHKDVPDDGKAHFHIHLCKVCNSSFSHVHKKHTQEFSETMPHFCKPCRIKANSNAKKEGYYVDEADINIVCDDDIDSVFVAEGAVIDDKEKAEKEKKTFRAESLAPTKGGKHQKRSVRIVLPQGEGYDDLKTYTIVYSKPDEPKIPRVREINRLPGVPDESGSALKQGSDNDLFPMIDRVLQHATVELDCGGVKIMGLVIGDRYILTYKHVLEHRLKIYKQLTLSCNRMGKKYYIDVSSENYKSFFPYRINGTEFHSDLCIITVRDNKFPPGPNLIKFFGTESRYHLANLSQGVLFGKSGDTRVSSKVGEVQLVGEVTYSGRDFPYSTGRTWKYVYPTSPGYCGSILVFDKRQLGSYLIGGIHLAGKDRGIGYSSVVTQEMIMEIIDEDTYVYPESFEDIIDRYELQTSGLTEGVECQQKDSMFEARGTACYTIGHLKKPLRLPTKGDIQCSPLFDNWDHALEPTVLTKHDPRLIDVSEPMSKATEKFVAETGDWNPEHVRSVRKHLVATAVRCYLDDGTLPSRMPTEEEAINGILGVMEPLNMDTASGFPSELYKPKACSGKKWAYLNIGTDDTPFYIPGPYLRKRLDNLYDTVGKGYIPDNMVKDVPKVEKRKIVRVQENETRLFNIPDQAVVIAMKRVTGIYVATQLRSKLAMNSTVGVNMLGFDPTLMMNALLSIGENLFEGDFSGWDGRFSAQTMKLCIDIVHDFNKEIGLYDVPTFVSKRGCYVIMHSTVYRYHVLGDVVYYIFTSMDSGTYVTSSWNTTGNGAQLRLVWFEMIGEKLREIKNRMVNDLPEEPHCPAFEHAGDDPYARAENNPACIEEFNELAQYNSMHAMDKNVSFGCNGDDIVGSVSLGIKKFFNSPAISKCLEKHGVLYTPPEKPRDYQGYADDDDGFRRFDQVQFLKCRFRKDPIFTNLFRAMMEKRTIEDLPAWVRKSDNPNKACEDNLLDALTFAAHHGEEYFEDLYKRLRVATKGTRVNLPVCFFEDFERRFYNECGMLY